MPVKKPISQKKFIKGLIACTPNLAQVPGSVPRVTNMVYTVRGALKTCDGSSVVTYPSSDSTGAGAFLSMKYYTDQEAVTSSSTGTQTAGVVDEQDTATERTGSSTFSVNLVNQNIVPGSVLLSFTIRNFDEGGPVSDTATDTFSGGMTDEYGSTGSINYSTGLITITLPSNYVLYSLIISANYNYYTGPTGGGSSIIGVTNLAYQVALQHAPDRGLSPTSGLSFSPTSGTVAAGTYRFAVTASDLIPTSSLLSGFRETYGTWGTYVLGGIGGINIAWSPVSNAASYVVYQVTSSPTGILLAVTTATSYSLQASPSGTATTIPGSNITETTVFRKLTTPTYGDSGILATLPSSIVMSAPNGFQLPFGYTPNGGQTGVLSPLPQLVQFVNSMILILGNGLAPMLYSSSSPTSAIGNTYVITYPSWVASTDYILDDYVIPSTPNGYYYQCIQAGESGGSAPTWPIVPGEQVTDGSIIWQCVGSTTSTSLRGAAHGLVYAGSLWLWNTYPETTSDNLDGPSCLKMSSLENPTSYDPLNVAFVDKDDGTEGMGMAVFSISEAGIPPSNMLILFKNYKSYSVNNVFGASNFSIQQIQTDMGCIAPRSIQFVPGLGVTRLTHLGFAVTDGISDKLISEEIRPYLFKSDPTIIPADTPYQPFAQSSQTVNPPMYVCGLSYNNNGGMINRLYCYDLVQNCWTIINLPMNVYALFQFRVGSIGVYTDLPTELGGYSDGIVRNWQNGDVNWDVGSPVSWSLQSPEVYSAGGSDPFFLSKLNVRGVSGSPNSTLTLIRQGQQDSSAKQPTRIWQGGANEFIQQALFNARMFNAAVLIQGNGVTEIDLIDWDAKSKPTGVPLTLMK